MFWNEHFKNIITHCQFSGFSFTFIFCHFCQQFSTLHTCFQIVFRNCNVQFWKIFSHAGRGQAEREAKLVGGMLGAHRERRNSRWLAALKHAAYGSGTSLHQLINNLNDLLEPLHHALRSNFEQSLTSGDTQYAKDGLEPSDWDDHQIDRSQSLAQRW